MKIFTLLISLHISIIFVNVLAGQSDPDEIWDIQYQYPAENMVINYQQVALQWSHTNIKEQVKLQVSNNESFSDIIVDAVVQANTMKLNHLKRHQEYYWRVIPFNDVEAAQTDAPYSFFKTSSFILDEPWAPGDVRFIPTWVNDNELLYIDNPNTQPYDLRIVNEEYKLKFSHSGRQEKFAVITEHWPRGLYKIFIRVDGFDDCVKGFTLN